MQTITERTLKKWRKEALETNKSFGIRNPEILTIAEKIMTGLCSRILRMTQELLDQHLLRKE